MRVLLVAATALAVATGETAIAASAHAAHARRSCTALTKVVDADTLTGLSTSLKEVTDSSGYAYIKPPEYTCEYFVASPPWGDAFGEPYEVGLLYLGYHSSAARFAALRSYRTANENEGPDYTVTTVNVGHGASAFAETSDLWTYYNVTAGEYPGLPQYVYRLWILTKHHNLLSLQFYNQSLTSEEELASTLLGHFENWL